jgi:putative transposase
MTGWISDYNTRPHETLGESPLQRWHALEQQGWQPVRLSAAECDDLARPRETRTVQRATVTLGTKTYFAPELEALDLHGRQVQVGYDIHDPARVWIHDLEGRRLCEALLNANTTPYFPLSAVDEARASRAREREKRLARHGDEIRAELGSVAPKPPVIRDASDIVPANREDRWWTRAVDVINRLATGDVQPEERAWLLTAATLPWFRARLHLRADGDQIRRLLTG